MKKWTIGMAVTLVLIISLVSVACASAPARAPTPIPAPTPSFAPAPAPAPAPRPPTINESAMYDQAKAGSGTAAVSVEEWAGERMIVRTANISIVVDEVRFSIDQIARLAQNFDGYVVSSNVWEESTPSPTIIIAPGYKGEVPGTQDWKRLAGTISIRIPSKNFDAAMSALRGLAVEVSSESTTSKDVTEEYVDLNAKLKNLQATEEQLLRLMEKAEKVEDILNIQRELSNVRGQIEQTKGRMQYLERTSETSLIEVSLQQSKLDVKFTADKALAKKGETITFIPQIAGGFSPYSYEWSFGDGRTSTSQIPTHAYQATGNYTVTLKVTDDRGNTDTDTRVDYITIRPGWNAGSIAGGAWNGLVVFGQVLADIVIWLGIFSPLWIVVGGLVYWFVFRRKKRK